MYLYALLNTDGNAYNSSKAANNDSLMLNLFILIQVLILVKNNRRKWNYDVVKHWTSYHRQDIERMHHTKREKETAKTGEIDASA